MFHRIFAAFLITFAVATAICADAPVTSRPEDILSFLNETVAWHRLLSDRQSFMGRPSDAAFLSENRQIADQVVQLAFEFARSEAQHAALDNQPADAQSQPSTSQYQNLLNLKEKSKQRLEKVQHELDSLKQQLPTATGRKRKMLESEVAETEDELELLKARHETLQNMLQFASEISAGSGPKGLQAQIEELARSVPVTLTDNSKGPAAGAAPVVSSAPTIASDDNNKMPTGIFALMGEMYDARGKLSLLGQSLHLTDALADSSKLLRTPLIARMKEFSKRSDDLANQPASQDTAVLAQLQDELKGLTKQYKQLAATILPLAKQNILLDVYKRNVTNWRSELNTHYSQLFRSLLWRAGMLIAILAVILATSHLWRRATFRYVQDARRRHQFLIVRRIIVVPLVCIVLVVAFASGLGSVSVFAGIATAGLAVALQNMIQSIAGYFVLIGKYGVRVGDRVQVADVTGDVIDIGMVRLHLVEIGSGPGARPTGRVVAFSNAVVFHPDSGIFKQIPGTNFTWHEVLLTLASDSDYRQTEERMLKAVNKVFTGYREIMETQRRGMERATHGLPAAPLQPESHLHLTGTGTQVIVRYPVEVEQASEIDDRITREVLDATGRTPVVQVSDEPGARENSAEALGAS